MIMKVCFPHWHVAQFREPLFPYHLSDSSELA